MTRGESSREPAGARKTRKQARSRRAGIVIVVANSPVTGSCRGGVGRPHAHSRIQAHRRARARGCEASARAQRAQWLVEIDKKRLQCSNRRPTTTASCSENNRRKRCNTPSVDLCLPPRLAPLRCGQDARPSRDRVAGPQAHRARSTSKRSGQTESPSSTRSVTSSNAGLCARCVVHCARHRPSPPRCLPCDLKWAVFSTSVLSDGLFPAYFDHRAPL